MEAIKVHCLCSKATRIQQKFCAKHEGTLVEVSWRARPDASSLHCTVQGASLSRNICNLTPQYGYFNSFSHLSYVEAVLRSMPANCERRQTRRRKRFKYQRLTRPAAFRYLILQPGNEDEPLCCKLITSNLDRSVRYEAISYVWGSPKLDCSIICNGKRLPITSSLEAVLRQVREMHTPRTIWVDQIAINQNDIAERGLQVSIMGRIYSQAQRVHVCLGGSTEQGLQLSSLVQDICNHSPPQIHLHADWMNESALRVVVQGEMWSDPRLDDWHHVASHEWFDRLWVLLEIGVAVQVRLLVGDVQIGWPEFMHTCRYMARFRKQSQHLQSRVGDIHSAIASGSVYYATSFRGPSIFLGFLQYCRRQRCADNRDRIYALLGHPLAPKANGKPLVSADYTIDAETCYVNFASKWISTLGDLEILSFVTCGTNLLHNTRPSWVPCWNSSRGMRHDTLVRQFCHADRGFETCFRIEGVCLLVRGIMIDSVDKSWELLRRGRPFKLNMPPDSLKSAWEVIRATKTRFCADVPPIECFCTALVKPDCPWESEGFLPGSAALSRHLTTTSKPQHESESPEEEELPGNLYQFQFMMEDFLSDRRFIHTKIHGIMGNALAETQPGDLCVIIFGCRMPMILRKSPFGYRVVGDVWLHGLTLGEAKQWHEDGNGTVQDFVLY